MLFKIVGVLVVFGGVFYCARKYMKSRSNKKAAGGTRGGGGGSQQK